jgi:hypothetical protein
MTWRSRCLRAARRYCRRHGTIGTSLGVFLEDRRPHPDKPFRLPWSWARAPWRRRAEREYLRWVRANRGQPLVPGASLAAHDGQRVVVLGNGVDWRAEP